MKNKSLEKRFITIVVIGILVNIFVLLIWFSVRINPIFPKTRNIKEEVFSNNIQSNYDNMNILKEDIKKLSDKYNVVINIEDIDGNVIINNDIRLDLPLVSKIVKVQNNPYLLKIYYYNTTNIRKLLLEVIIVQVLVVILILIFTYIYTNNIILKPIRILIDDIKNYKFGKKVKRKKLNNEFGLISDEFIDLTEKLDDEKKEQTRIIASISHDLKTPLTSIIGYSNLLKDQELSDESQKYNEKIYDKAINIKDILSTFDDYLLNYEKMELKKTKVLIKDLVDALNDDYKIELMNNNIEFSVGTNVYEEAIYIDVLKMKRVFANMIQNSTRYLKSGGLIKIEILNDKDNYLFKVIDNGPGVDKKIIKKIFDPLFTTDSSRKISGLGLSICKEFIEMHEGKIKAYNDNGLTIEFTIPK